MLEDIRGPWPRIDDVRIRNLRPLIPPAILLEEMPVTDPIAGRSAATARPFSESCGATISGCS